MGAAFRGSTVIEDLVHHKGIGGSTSTAALIGKADRHAPGIQRGGLGEREWIVFASEFPMSDPSPAPRFLLWTQVFVAGLLGLGLLHLRAERAPLHDPADAAVILGEALARAQPGAVLQRGEEPNLASFLSLAAQAAGLQGGRVRLGEGPVGPTHSRVFVRLSGQLDPFDLPALLQLSSGFMTPMAPERIRLVASAEGAGALVIAFSVVRAEDKGVTSVTGLPPIWVPAWEAAGALRHRRALAAVSRAQLLTARDRLALLRNQLPAALIDLRAAGGRLEWSPREGLRRLPG
jgi:hypothetical protein